MTVYDERDGEVREGAITCGGCGFRYPVINGIPRMLPGRLQGELLGYHGDFFARRKDEFAIPAGDGVQDASDSLKKKTIKSFSFQWNVFSEMFEEYVKHWESYIPAGADKEFFSGKTGLDAGCGFGRHIYRAAKNGAEMVGIDLSEAVEAAYKNTSGLENVHIVQGDIYNPPLRYGVFDFIYSLGVLHHLPDPEKGFDSIAGLLGHGQRIFIWCYDNEKPRKNRMYERIRKITTGMDFGTLYAFCYIAALGVRLGLNLPASALKKLGLFGGRKFPYDYYNNFPLRVLHADLFDVFSVPSTRYYDQPELELWFRSRGLNVLESGHKVSGWTVLGEK